MEVTGDEVTPWEEGGGVQRRTGVELEHSADLASHRVRRKRNCRYKRAYVLEANPDQEPDAVEVDQIQLLETKIYLSPE